MRECTIGIQHTFNEIIVENFQGLAEKMYIQYKKHLDLQVDLIRKIFLGIIL